MNDKKFRSSLLGEPEREISMWGVWGIIFFAFLFGLFVWRITASQMGFSVPGFAFGAAITSNWAIAAPCGLTMFCFWRYNKRPYKLDLNDIIKDNAAWAGFWMAFMMGLVALGAIFRLY